MHAATVSRKFLLGVSHNKLSWLVSVLHETGILNVVVQCIGSILFYNKLTWFVSELPEKDIANVLVQCR